MSWLEDAPTMSPEPAPAAPEQNPMYGEQPAEGYGMEQPVPLEGGYDQYAQQPQEQHVGDPYASSTAMAAAPSGLHGGELSVQAPVLPEVHESVNTGAGTVRDGLTSLVLDVEVPVEVCFGDANLTVEQFLELGQGAVIELERSIEQPIELRVRGQLVARGQLVTINGRYGLRVTEMAKRS